MLIAPESFPTIINRIKSSFEKVEYDSKNHKLIIPSSSEKSIQLRLPVYFNYSKNTFIDKNILVVLIESGHASIGVISRSSILYHTSEKAYMVRKKQGFSQIKYLKTKGKSRAGSRVRLAETKTFIQNISQKINQIWTEYDIDIIGAKIPKNLSPYLFSKENQLPFDKNDPSYFTLPFYLAEAKFKQLKQTHFLLQQAAFIYSPEEQEIIDYLTRK